MKFKMIDQQELNAFRERIRQKYHDIGLFEALPIDVGAEYMPSPNSKKYALKRHPNQDAYIYLEDVAHDVGAILHDKWLENKPKALMELPGVELSYDEVAKLYRQYREKGNLERFICELYKEV